METTTRFSPIANSVLDKESIKTTEQEILDIRMKALDKIREKYPQTDFVVDTRDIEEYSHLIWAYPDKLFYTGFKLPKEFKNEDELIDAIVNDTMTFYAQYQEALQQIRMEQ